MQNFQYNRYDINRANIVHFSPLLTTSKNNPNCSKSQMSDILKYKNTITTLNASILATFQRHKKSLKARTKNLITIHL